MKYFAFRIIKHGDSPIIRVTYKTWWGGLVRKDVCRADNIDGYWVFMESGRLTHQFEPINTFVDSGEEVYIVNGEKL